MPRKMSSYAKSQAFAMSSGEAWLILVTIRHEQTGTLLRVVNNTEDVTSRGNVYTAYPFKFTLPLETGEGIGVAEFEIDNVELTLISMLRAAIEAPRLDIEVILSGRPDTVELSVFNLALRQVTWDAQTIKGTLVNEDLLSTSYPGYMYDPQEWAGLF